MQNSTEIKSEKQSYTKPEVTVHGSVESLTQVAGGNCSSHPITLKFPELF